MNPCSVVSVMKFESLDFISGLILVFFFVFIYIIIYIQPDLKTFSEFVIKPEKWLSIGNDAAVKINRRVFMINSFE